MSQDIKSVLSKTTINYAFKRGVYFDVGSAGCADELVTLWIGEIEEDGEPACEPLVIYTVNGDGSFSFYGNVYLPSEIKEELPAFIMGELELRKVVAFLRCELNKKQ